jgi:hypothetical protein
MLQKSEERRQAPRHSLSRLAKINLGGGTPPLYCVVTDIAEGGVRIHSNGFHVPEEFMLLLSSDDGPFHSGTYRVVWRRDEEVGAKLIRVS